MEEKGSANRLDPRVKSVWRLSALVWIVLLALCATVPLVLVAMLDDDPEVSVFMHVYGTALVVCIVLAVLLWVVVLPPIRYARWRYEVSEQYLQIAKGIFWRSRYMIPFIRVQNTDTKQGPILRAFNLASVTVATAAEEHEIPGLDLETADSLRDRAAELARLAREDV